MVVVRDAQVPFLIIAFGFVFGNLRFEPLTSRVTVPLGRAVLNLEIL